MDCTDLYLKINHNLQENIQASLSSSHYTLFANANAFIDDYGLWQKWISILVNSITLLGDRK